MGVNDSGVPLIGVPQNWEELEHSYAALQTWLGTLNNNVSTLTAALTVGTAVFSTTLAAAPSALGIADAGKLYYITDYGHLVRWTGSTFVFADGGNQFIAHFASAPDTTSWKLCNGASATYMKVGTTLTTGSLTLPDLTGTAAYLKCASAYGSVTAAAAPGISGSVATNNPGTSSNGAHTHTMTTGGPSATVGTDFAGGGLAGDETHTHSGTTSSDGAHTHTVDSHDHAVGSLAVDATGDPRHINMLPYFRL